MASEQNFYEAPAFVRHFDMRHFQERIHEFEDKGDVSSRDGVDSKCMRNAPGGAKKQMCP